MGKKNYILIAMVILTSIGTNAQITKEYFPGEVSYISSQNVYVKFNSTKNIEPGDTLFIKEGSTYIPALIVDQKSSISCVGSKIGDLNITKSMLLFSKLESKKEEELIAIEEPEEKSNKKEEFLIEKPIEDQKVQSTGNIQKIHGRLTAASYSNLIGSNFSGDPRFRYTFSFKGENLSNSRLDFNSYISFKHQMKQWEDVKSNPFQALKVYDLSLAYQFHNFDISFGRSINRSVSNLGAIDGLQLSYATSALRFGILLGSKPDHFDYSLNTKLPEAGLFLEHSLKGKHGSLKNSLGLFEQRNGTMTDRRYIYFQHYNTLVKKLFLMSSFQIDIYQNIDGQQKGDFKITSMYLSMRYRFSRSFDVFASYDNRKNIIYYETFKSSIEQLIENESRQGFRLRFNFRPVRLMTIGVSGNYRIQGNGLSPSKNLHAYMNFTRIPVLKVSSSLSYNFLDTYYMQSQIYGIRLNRDFFKGKLGTGLYYRYFNYVYKLSESKYNQQLLGINLNWRMAYDITFSLNHELTFINDRPNQRSYLRLSKRFRS